MPAWILLLLGANPSWPAPDPNLEPEALSRPQQMPDDPAYPPGPDCTGQLELYSFTPACTPEVAQPALGSGIHADRAWLLTIGRPEVTIAFVDTGADLGDPDLVARFLLNAGELPRPSTSSTAHDANGDGAFTVLDYTTATGTVPPTVDRVSDARLRARSDRGDVDGNGLLDPGDLIAIFSDGSDGDLNGYVDDIAGWDFLDDDNDPTDPGDLRSGTTEARRAVATANNGVGGAGVCPACTLLALRAGREGTAEAHRIAVAIAYAVDARAAVIASSLQAPDHDDFFTAAADYAFERAVPIVASSGRNSSIVPATVWPPDRVLVAGGVRHDRTDLRRATSALAPDPCASFGPRLDLSAPTRCDFAGTGLTAGVLGLIRSAERGIPRASVPPLDRPLDAAEIMMLAAASTDDVAAPGWDQRTGYGRLNARSALDAVARRRIPVPVRITSPEWFEVLDPTAKETLLVTGTVSNRRYDRATWQLAFAPGIDPRDGEFTSLGTGTVGEGEDAIISGEIPAAGLFPDPAAAPRVEDALAVTIRLRTSASSGGDVIGGELRRVVFVHRDLELLPAFPVRLGARPSSPRIADLDGDGATEVVLATSQGSLQVIGARGTARNGWPQRAPRWTFPELHAAAPAFSRGALDLDVREPILGTPAVAANLVAAVTAEGSVLAFDGRGQAVEGFPVRIERGDLPGGITCSPALADLDGDGSFDILVPDGTGKLHAFALTGSALDGFPIDAGEPTGAPAVGDVDGDGTPDLALATATHMFLFHASGAPHDGWPIAIPPASAPPTPVLADTNRDDRLEIVLAVPGRPLTVFEADGTIRLAAIVTRELGAASDASRTGPPILAAGQPAIADLDGDGAPEAFLRALPESAFAGLSPEQEIERLAAVWSLSTGAFAAAYPRLAADPSASSAVAADVDGDRRPELVTGDGRYRITAFSVSGRHPTLWPKLTGGTSDGSPAAGDLDGDLRTDIAAATREGALFVWRTQSRLESVQWEGFGHDNRATHNAAAAVSVQPEADLGGGCACTASAGDPAGPPLGLLVLLWLAGCFSLKRGASRIAATLPRHERGEPAPRRGR